MYAVKIIATLIYIATLAYGVYISVTMILQGIQIMDFSDRRLIDAYTGSHDNIIELFTPKDPSTKRDH
jgi:hypothetical protein